VKLGILAPQEIAVVRGEVRLTREQNLAAAGAMKSSPEFVVPAELRSLLP
jgi:sRNA-binding carbon storage regulator CsrA